jgi:hypothetical protein
VRVGWLLVVMLYWPLGVVSSSFGWALVLVRVGSSWLFIFRWLEVLTW